MNPSILHFSRTGSVIKALFFLGVAAIAFAVAGLMHAERASPPPITVGAPGMALLAPTPHRDPLTLFKIPLLIIAGATCLFHTGRHGLRALTRQTAVRIEGGRLYFHPSYAADPNPLPAADIAEAVCDRADRLPGEMSGSVRFGARARHGLYLRYRADGSNRELRLIDNDIDGGTEQLRRFAAQIDAWRRPATEKVER